jgi:hypothetical protein
MKLEFADERITEFANGPLHLVNDGKPFEIDSETAPILLRSRHYLDGEYVDTFRPADKQTKKEVATIVEATYPDGFPHADKLVDAGLRFADLGGMTAEQLTELKGIGPKSAEEILAFGREN